MTTFTTQDRQDAQRTPLTKEELIALFTKVWDSTTNQNGVFIEFARAIERAHGIGE
jgi:hypothetical protein